MNAGQIKSGDKTTEQCKWHTVAVAAPLECVPCYFCGKRDELYAELPVMGDHDGRGFVMRIGCLCPKSIRIFGDANRTEFERYDLGIIAWNGLQESHKQDASYLK